MIGGNCLKEILARLTLNLIHCEHLLLSVKQWRPINRRGKKFSSARCSQMMHCRWRFLVFFNGNKLK
jgi:hypothetical protein